MIFEFFFVTLRKIWACDFDLTKPGEKSDDCFICCQRKHVIFKFFFVTHYEKFGPVILI